MAVKQKRKKRTTRKQQKRRNRLLILGFAALLLVLLILFGRVGQWHTPPETQPTSVATEPPTLPPPESNPYGPEDFAYDGDYLTCLASPSKMGIDVSAYQKDIDWEAVAQSGVTFVMIRVGYRGYESGNITEDAYAKKNYEGARAAGLQVGVYFFSQAVSVEEAQEEAEFVLRYIRDWEVSLPVVFDWEYVREDARTGQADKRLVTDCTIAFCEAVRKAGYGTMVYFNRHQAMDFLHLEELTEYPFWLALYSDQMTYPYRVRMWQYTQTGSIPGIQGDVDINLWLS